MNLSQHKGSGIRKLAVVATVAGMGAVGVFAPSASAATPHLTPANTKITGTSSKVAFSAMVQGVTLAVTCTKLTASGTTPADGLTITLPTAPTFSGCTDDLGGTDTVKTTGAWKLVANSTGSKITLYVPKKGATFNSSVLASCTVIVAPTAADKIIGNYNNVASLSFKAVKFAIAGSGCSAGPTSTVTSTVKFTPGVKVVS